MNWADFRIAVAQGLVASAESVANIISGTTKVGNADKLDGNDSSYFATKASVTNITNGTTKVGNADKLDGLDSGSFPRYYTHATDYNGGTNGNKVDFNTLTQVGFHLMAGNFSEAPNKPKGFYGDGSVIVTGNSTCLTQIVVIGDTICFRQNAWNGEFGEWQYGGDADTLDGFHASNFVAISGATMSGDINMNGCKIKQCSGDYSAELKGQYANACLELREKDLVGGSSTDIGYAPTIGFHWAGVVGAAILMDSTGAFHFVRSDGTYCPLKTSSANVIVSTTAPADTTAVWIVP